jgi:hypothetical protein
MKFYLAIAFALLMATAYGIRNKQDVGTTASGTTIVDPIAAVTPVATPVDDDTCTTDSDEYDNGNGICTWTNTWCNDDQSVAGTYEMSGTSSSDYTDICTDGSETTSHCANSYGEEWSEGSCTSTGSWSDVKYECSNNYYNSWATDEIDTWHNNNQCTNSDGSSDCKLAYFIILLTSL